MKKILLICTQSNQVCGFRKALIEKFQALGAKVSVIAFDNEREADIKNMGVEFFLVSASNRSLNPFQLFSLQKQCVKIIKEVQPDVVFTFMLKPNTIGVLSARQAGVKEIYSMVEGAGDVFINNSLKWKLIRLFVCGLYKIAFSKAKNIFFLNKEDEAEFVQRKLVKKEQCVRINGIGIDLNHFTQKSITSKQSFLMVARLMKTKGVFEYCQAARIVKQKYPEARFSYLGGEGALRLADIQEYIDDNTITYLGTAKDVRPVLEACTVYVLPSYREGFPVSVMEAAATGRGLLVSDCPGCNAAVIDGYNGFQIKTREIGALAEKMCYFIENPKAAIDMGNNARKFAEENFDQEKINSFICKMIGLI